METMSHHEIKIISRAQAERKLGLKLDRSVKLKFDCGKYCPKVWKTGSKTTTIAGRYSEPYTVWYEHRKDSDGPYIQLYCLKRNLIESVEGVVEHIN